MPPKAPQIILASPLQCCAQDVSMEIMRHVHDTCIPKSWKFSQIIFMEYVATFTPNMSQFFRSIFQHHGA
jgi:hypothetical protein